MLLKLVRRGEVCFEVGSNIGQHTPFLSQLVGPGGRVIAFEPVKANCEALARRIATDCNFQNVCIERVALGASEGPAEMFVPDVACSMASLRVHRNSLWDGVKAIQTVKTETTTLDRYVIDSQIGRLDFMKVDIEGAETMFLDGAKQTLLRFRPIILMEIDRLLSQTFDSSPELVFQRIIEAGYGYAYKLRSEGYWYSVAEPVDTGDAIADYLFSAKPIKPFA